MASSTELELVEGWTADIDMLVKQASGAAFDLTGATVALILKDNLGVTVDTTGDVTAPAPTTGGTVRWSPDAAEITAARSPYSLHVKITLSAKDTFLPQGQALRVKVRPQ